jgi:hypothetical protein
LRTRGLTLLLAPAACGGAIDPDDPVDAPAAGDAPALLDGTQPGSDAAPMSVPDFGSCASTIECANAESECLPVAALDGASICLPSCSVSSECPVDTFCYVREDGPYALLKNRCFYSYCGQGFMNGETSGPCRVGAEQSLPWAEQLPGWCYPFHDGVWGICLEFGDLGAGEACDGAETRCRGAGCRNCGPGTACVGGSCQELCDPRRLLEGTAVACPIGDGCRDRSEVHVSESGLGRGSWGTCDLGDHCLTTGPATCPATVDGDPQGCMPTNPVRATGFCDERAAGLIATGAVCPPDPPSGDANECVAGNVCVSDATGTHCQMICELGPDAAPCPDGTCAPLLWSTDPEIPTQDWGTCR